MVIWQRGSQKMWDRFLVRNHRTVKKTIIIPSFPLIYNKPLFANA